MQLNGNVCWWVEFLRLLNLLKNGKKISRSFWKVEGFLWLQCPKVASRINEMESSMCMTKLLFFSKENVAISIVYWIQNGVRDKPCPSFACSHIMCYFFLICLSIADGNSCFNWDKVRWLHPAPHRFAMDNLKRGEYFNLLINESPVIWICPNP